jgi:fluoroquinolone transport system ATP-binding protein
VTNLIRVENLSHDYTGKEKYTIANISFAITDGEILGFLGPSGAGKSTVQNIMTGLLPIQQGDVYYENQSIRKVKSDFFNKVGVSFEHSNLYTKLSGYENLKYFAGLFNTPTEDPMKLLDMVGLRESSHKKAAAYSKGMKQRLVFARSLINKPKLLFLDEPTSGLDPVTASKIKDIILEKKREGCTIFLTTHNMFIADELCDRVAFLNEGRIVAQDAPRNLKLQYGEKSLKVEYRGDNKEISSEIFFLANENDRNAFSKLVNSGTIETIHSQEATLEQIFIKLTGRSLA